jgi:hypothetical protein
MGKQFPSIEPVHREFIEKQHIFFNASACAEGHVNLSPRDVASLRVLGPTSVFWLDLTGSGNETAAHLRRDGRLTLMFCAFQAQPLILRLYGRGRILSRQSAEYERLLSEHFAGQETPGARQMIWLDVERVQTSCGMNVPLYTHVGPRDQLIRWAQNKGKDGLKEYWREKNVRSIDGFPTGLLKDTEPDPTLKTQHLD